MGHQLNITELARADQQPAEYKSSASFLRVSDRRELADRMDNYMSLAFSPGGTTDTLRAELCGTLVIMSCSKVGSGKGLDKHELINLTISGVDGMFLEKPG